MRCILDGSETISISGLEEGVKPRMNLDSTILRSDGSKSKIKLLCRIDTLDEAEYYRHGGILHFVLRKMMKDAA